jgi:hypothetical protein
MLRWSKSSVVVAVASTSLFVGAATAAKPAQNACGLLTKTEVVAAFGQPLLNAKGGKTPTGVLYCNWIDRSSNVISVAGGKDRGGVRYRQYFLHLAEKTPVSGLGTEAATDGRSSIVARTATAFVQITADGMSLDRLTTLAKRALTRA